MDPDDGGLGLGAMGGASSDGADLSAGWGHRPRDRHSLVWWSMAVFGAGFLFPYNSLISALDYYGAIYPSYSPGFVIPVVYTVVTFVFMALTVLFGVTRFSVALRIRLGFALFLLPVAAVMATEAARSSGLISQPVSYGFLLLAVVVVGLGGGVQQSSMYGYAGIMGYAAPMMMGESVAGLVVSLNRIATKAAFSAEGDSPQARRSSYVFFGISLAFLVACTALYERVRVSAFSRHFTAKYAHVRRERARGEDDYQAQLVPAEEPAEAPGGDGGSAIPLIQKVAAQNGYYLSAVFVTYLVTLALFPGSLTKVRTGGLGDWMPILLIALFNFFDLVGKVIPLFPFHRAVRWQPRRLLHWSLARIILIPVMVWIVAGAVHPGAAFVVDTVLGVTNGYLGSVLMAQASRDAPNESKELTGNVMTLSLLSGLSVGAMGALVVELAAS